MILESFWKDNDLEEKVVKLLSRIEYYQPDHHLGRPFLTAYQLAIQFKQSHKTIFECFGHPLGGRGTGKHFSFTSYLAGQLSQRIKSGEIGGVEGAFLSNQQLLEISFNDDGETVTSSLTGTEYDLSMFRYVD